MLTLALAGDTMLGRLVGERLAEVRPEALFAEEVVAVAAEADLFVCNLECAISDRGKRWPDADKPFFFRAPPVAVEVLRHLGVDAVTLANNHALDYGAEALLDTTARLADAGIGWVGAGVDEAAAREPLVLRHGDTTVGVVGVTDHPWEFSARPDRPGVAFAELRLAPSRWLLDTVAGLATDVVLVTPHWGTNMVTEPVPQVRRAAAALRAAGATLVAGHSAHVPHGVGDGVLYDVGDFIDDYRTDPVLRNDLGLLFLVTVEHGRAVRVEAVPLALRFCRTDLATGDDAEWMARRFERACAALGTEVVRSDGRLVVTWS